MVRVEPKANAEESDKVVAATSPPFQLEQFDAIHLKAKAK